MMRRNEQRGLDSLLAQEFDNARIGVDKRKRLGLPFPLQDSLIFVVELAEIVEFGSGKQRCPESV
jgi:hypothetical protein